VWERFVWVWGECVCNVCVAVWCGYWGVILICVWDNFVSGFLIECVLRLGEFGVD